MDSLAEAVGEKPIRRTTTLPRAQASPPGFFKTYQLARIGGAFDCLDELADLIRRDRYTLCLAIVYLA